MSARESLLRELRTPTEWTSGEVGADDQESLRLVDAYRAEVSAEAASEAEHKDSDLKSRVTRAIHALKTPTPDGSQHYRSGWDDGVDAAIDAARAAIEAGESRG